LDYWIAANFLKKRALVFAKNSIPVAAVTVFLAALIFFTAGNESGIGVTGFDLDQYRTMSEYIYRSTGWTYAEARNRIYYVYGDNDCTPEFIYDSVEKAVGKIKNPAFTSDGFFVCHIPWAEKCEAQSNILTWFLSRDLNSTVLEGLKSGGIHLGIPLVTHNMAIFSYQIKDHVHLPVAFQNSGLPYAGKSDEKLWTRQPASKALAFVFNDCPGREASCDINFDISVLKKKEMLVTIQAPPLSQPDEWTLPDWTQQILRPFVELECDGNSRRYELADTLGFFRNSSSMLLAPLAWKIPISCTSVGKISVGYEKSNVLTRGKILGLRGQQQSAEFSLQ
jgi:hypothetical protein